MTAKKLLEKLNREYAALHKKYEDLYWISYMGDHSVDQEMNRVLKAKDEFCANEKYAAAVENAIKLSIGKEKKKLLAWRFFFNKYKVPIGALKIKEKIDFLESEILKKMTSQKEGYVDPETKKFIGASKAKMRIMMRETKDEKIRKACFAAVNALARNCIDEYVELVGLRNRYARESGYADFYEYKLQNNYDMSKKDLFSLFDEIYKKTKYVFGNIRRLEKKNPGLRKPWNFSYMTSGNFTKEDDPYFQFNETLLRWGKSFAAMGVDFRGGKLKLDLVERKGKYANGFCRWPDIVSFKKNKRIPGSANFTSNAVLGQIGSGVDAIHTLFHEGGHAAHLLNTENSEVCLNTEHPPACAAWDETQSMFLESVLSSMEWKTRYAKNKNGQAYPFDLFERKVEKTGILSPLRLMGIMHICEFEKEIYESERLDAKIVMDIAAKMCKKYADYDETYYWSLSVPHIYSWESACDYQGYGLAELAVCQWRDYFYKKYGYIVDNPRVYSEMRKVWKIGSAMVFKKLVKLATGKELSAKAFLKEVTRSNREVLESVKKKIRRMAFVPEYKKKIKLNVEIIIVDGKKKICDNKKSFEDMAEKYEKWLIGKMKAG